MYDQRGYSLLFHRAGSVLIVTMPHALVAAAMNVGIRVAFKAADFDYVSAFPNAAVYTPFSLGLAFLLVFRSSQAYQRYVEAVSHCFEIRSQLSNAMMQLHAYTNEREDTREFHRRHRRLTYAFQRAAMQELRGEHDVSKLMHIASLRQEEVDLLEQSPNRPLTLMHWMLTSVTERWDTGGFRCAPPVIARVFTNYNDCMNAYNRARKIARTPFPFPYAQLTMAFLLIGQITIPALFVLFVRDDNYGGGAITSAMLAAVATWMYFAMHQVAVELEDPYGYDWNDLPLDWYSAEVFDDIVSHDTKSQRPAAPCRAEAPHLLHDCIQRLPTHSSEPAELCCSPLAPLVHLQHAIHGRHGGFMPWHDPSTKPQQALEMTAVGTGGEGVEGHPQEDEAGETREPRPLLRPTASVLFPGGADAAVLEERSRAVWGAHDGGTSHSAGGGGGKVSNVRKAGPISIGGVAGTSVRQSAVDESSHEHQRRAAQPAKMDEVARLEKVAQLLRKREKRNSQYLH